MHELNWTHGMPGKGAVMDDGQVITWNYSGHMDDAIHAEVLEEMGLDENFAAFTFYIEPEGSVHALEGETTFEVKKALEDLGFNLEAISVYDPDGWTASVRVSNVLNWDDGQYGRGGITTDGTVHTFDSDEYYNHADYENKHRLRFVCYFGIQPDGQALCADARPFEQWEIDVIEDADPRLHVIPETEMRWMG